MVKTNKATGLFRHDDAALPNALAFGYVLLTYGFGLYFMLSDSGWLNAVGVLALAHSMVIAAYLIHETAHLSLFRKKSITSGLQKFCCGLPAPVIRISTIFVINITAIISTGRMWCRSTFVRCWKSIRDF